MNSSGSSITVNDRVPDTEVYKPRKPPQVSHWKLVSDQTHVTDEVLNHHYKGSGTEEDPYIVEFIPHDRRNPMQFPAWKKWLITLLVAFATLAVSFASSAYSGGISQIILQFGASQEIATLGISLFVLGFAIGPLRRYQNCTDGKSSSSERTLCSLLSMPVQPVQKTHKLLLFYDFWLVRSDLHL